MGGMIMEQNSYPNDTRSIFADGKADTNVEAYTDVWVRLINLLEQNKHGWVHFESGNLLPALGGGPEQTERKRWK